MKKKAKMTIINNYAEIYKIIFACKQILKVSKDERTLLDATNIINETIQLKEFYEKSIIDYKINDASFLVLKKELDETLKIDNICTTHPLSTKQIFIDKARLEKELVEINIKYKKTI